PGGGRRRPARPRHPDPAERARLAADPRARRRRDADIAAPRPPRHFRPCRDAGRGNGSLLALARRSFAQLAALARPSVPPEPGGAILWFGAITYAFAIDPKPRMFLLVAAAAAAIFSAQGVSLWRDGRKAIVGALATVVVAIDLFYAATIPDLRALEPPAEQWIR